MTYARTRRLVCGSAMYYGALMCVAIWASGCSEPTAPRQLARESAGPRYRSGVEGLALDIADLEALLSSRQSRVFTAARSDGKVLSAEQMLEELVSVRAAINAKVNLTHALKNTTQGGSMCSNNEWFGRDFFGYSQISRTGDPPPGFRIVNYIGRTTIGGSWTSADMPDGDMEGWQAFANGHGTFYTTFKLYGSAPYASGYDQTTISGEFQNAYLKGSHRIWVGDYGAGDGWSPYCFSSAAASV